MDTNQQQKISLSAREVETIEWLIRGCSIHEAAEKMGVSVPSIDKYIRQAKAKTNARTRGHLVAIAIRKELL